ncbi:DNA repair protein RecO [Aestuariibacter salexigens]|uniref:DNA repair protein RecO n=1 Tax=Aestuariibacter salexigens TaxID=226010 RepID=UPI000411B106|nr:DNA repair protein RecO [Aestuariibacter salexigens]
MLRVEGVVLHRRAYRETSFLLDLFCRESGKISAVAKGVRSAKSDRKSLLQPFQLLECHLYGRHELKNLGSVDALQPAMQLQGLRLYCAMYLNELLNRVLPKEEPCPQLFNHYLSILQQFRQLDDSLNEVEPLLREFEFALLSELGYMPDLCEDSHGEVLRHDGHYMLSADEGLVASADNQRSFRGEALMLVNARQWGPESMQCAKRLSRQLLAPLLGDKPLKSRELFAPFRTSNS